MRTPQQLWLKVAECRRVANATANPFAAERLRIHLYELITNAAQADEQEAQLWMQGFYGELAAMPRPERLS